MAAIEKYIADVVFALVATKNCNVGHWNRSRREAENKSLENFVQPFKSSSAILRSVRGISLEPRKISRRQNHRKKIVFLLSSSFLVISNEHTRLSVFIIFTLFTANYLCNQNKTTAAAPTTSTFTNLKLMQLR